MITQITLVHLLGKHRCQIRDCHRRSKTDDAISGRRPLDAIAIAGRAHWLQQQHLFLIESLDGVHQEIHLGLDLRNIRAQWTIVVVVHLLIELVHGIDHCLLWLRHLRDQVTLLRIGFVRTRCAAHSKPIQPRLRIYMITTAITTFPEVFYRSRSRE
jgi:hypothetical protein